MTLDPVDNDQVRELKRCLQGMIESHLDRAQLPLEIDELRRLSGGLSRENWTFAATWRSPSGGRERQRLIVRRDPAGSILETDRHVEFKVLKALEISHVPAPRAYWSDPDGKWLGTPALIMEMVEGDSDYLILNGDASLTDRLQLAQDFLSAVTQIQAVDWKRTELDAVLDDPGPDAGLSALAFWEGEYRKVQLEPMPELEVILGWLRRHARPSTRTVLVHGDFKPGNALVKDGRVTAVLDWETAHLGDPLEDLGWVTNPVRRNEHQIAGHWERAQIVAAYEERTGDTVDDEALLWWNVLACWKLSVIILTGVRAFVDGRIDTAYQYPGWLIRKMFTLTAVS